MTQSGIKNIAFGLAVLISASVDILVTTDLTRHLVGPLGSSAVSVALIVVRSIQITTVFVVAEWVLLRVWARDILGQWAYKSDSGNYGLAEITLEHGEFRYRVQLYKSPGDVAAALDGHTIVQPFAHVHSKLSKYAEGIFDTDYHIEFTDGSYLPRNGLLTILRTRDPEVRTGNWSSMFEGATMRSGRLDLRRRASFLQKYVNVGSPIFSDTQPEEDHRKAQSGNIKN